MPQMAPLLWNMLFISSTLILILTIMKTYFFFNSKNANKEKVCKTKMGPSNKTWLW